MPSQFGYDAIVYTMISQCISYLRYHILWHDRTVNYYSDIIFRDSEYSAALARAGSGRQRPGRLISWPASRALRFSSPRLQVLMFQNMMSYARPISYAHPLQVLYYIIQYILVPNGFSNILVFTIIYQYVLVENLEVYGGMCMSEKIFKPGHAGTYDSYVA